MKKLVVITGASSGIGKSIAESFSKNGYPVLLLARRANLMEEMNLENSMCKSVDVSDLESVKKAIKEGEEKFGKVDLLINCAGVMLLGDSKNQDFAEWNNMIDVNIKGILTGTNVVLKDMVERNEGTIINISSIAGRKTFDNHAVYCGTKYAVHAITESIRKEVSNSSVRMITIAPGVVETPLLSHTSDEGIKGDYNTWKETIEGGLDTKRIVECVEFAYNMPQDVCVREIVIAKTKQED
ncbi:SDR family oxidoreductase [Clostridium chrysemydis]|uniref:SDR family oxidoreductase n=1 Tax=Clostridium chrysemydis TaxID=2665504 RepID=UPI001883CC11|nr:SDR family oxidoreductase [Clostridium chrysemydis]